MLLNSQIFNVPTWLHENCKKLDSMLETQRLPHTILFCGNAGIGKSEVATVFSKVLLCSSDNRLPCDNCKSCKLFDQHTHGDFLYVSHEEPRTIIGIDQVRNAIEFANKTSSFSYRKVVLINPAESMQRNASNAILKFLEEPPENTILLLVSNREWALPATVLSRCSRLVFHSPDPETAYHWLSERAPDACEFSKTTALSLRQPLKALDLIKSKEFDRLMAVLSTSNPQSVLSIDHLRSLSEERNPDKLFLEYLCLQLEKFLKQVPATFRNGHANKSLFECQRRLRQIIANIEEGVALNVNLNFTYFVNKLIKCME